MTDGSQTPGQSLPWKRSGRGLWSAGKEKSPFVKRKGAGLLCITWKRRIGGVRSRFGLWICIKKTPEHAANL